MKTSDFDYYLPEELIAQTPLKNRETSRLLILDKETGKIEHKHFYDIVDYLNKGDVLVRNNTKVIPARIFGIKSETGAHVEVLLLKQIGDYYECLVGNAKVFQVEWLIHYKHCDLEFKDFLDRFIDRYDIREYVNNKWNNSKYEDDNLELKKYINLLLKEFIDNYKDKGNYIVEGLQLFTLIDYAIIKDYYIIVKGTSSFNSLKNRIKRDYQKRRDYKFMLKIKWFLKC